MSEEKNSDLARRASYLIIGLVAMICITAYLAYVSSYLPSKMIDSVGKGAGAVIEKSGEAISNIARAIGGAFKTDVRVTNVVMGTMEDMKATPKLVTSTATLTIEIVRKSTKTTLWKLLDLGDTVTRLRVPGNKAQYYIPIQNMTEDDFYYDYEKHILIVTVDDVILDRDFVDIQSNPDKIEYETSVGWARLSGYSGKRVERQARKAVRSHVLMRAGSPLSMRIAREDAKVQLKKLLQPISSSLADGVTLEIKFKGVKDERRSSEKQ